MGIGSQGMGGFVPTSAPGVPSFNPQTMLGSGPAQQGGAPGMSQPQAQNALAQWANAFAQNLAASGPQAFQVGQPTPSWAQSIPFQVMQALGL